MKREGGVSIIPCKINGVDLAFAFDTGASDVTISLGEAIYMLEQGSLSSSDILGVTDYMNADGEVSKGYVINIKKIEFAGLQLYNIKALIVKDLDAPLLLGQSAIKKIGVVQLDLGTNTLTILKGNGQFDYTNYTQNYQHTYNTVSDEQSDRDATVNVFVTDEKHEALYNLMVVLKAKKTGKEYPAFTDIEGSFSLQLPPGDSYETIVLGNKAFTSATVLDIPSLNTTTTRFVTPFRIDIEYEAPKSFRDCLFLFNKHDVQAEYYKSLDSLADYLNIAEKRRVEIDGYTDSSEMEQLELSLSRAEAVKAYLIGKGIDSNRILTKGHNFVITQNEEDSFPAAQYRRVEIDILDSLAQPSFIKDSILDNYTKKGYVNDHFKSTGRSDENGKRQGHWYEYEAGKEALYQIIHQQPEKIISNYLLYEEGDYSDGLRTGNWNTYIIEDSTFTKTLLKKVSFKNGKEDGAFQYFYADGNIAAAGTYVGGNVEGSLKIYYEDGKTFASQLFMSNKKNGEEKCFFRGGQLKRISNYANDVKEGKEESYYENGSVEESTNYTAGMMDGDYRFYYPSGLLWTERIYKNGLLENVKTLVDDTGNKLYKGTFSNGSGLLNYYTIDGKIYEILKYKNGLKVAQ
ncbi:MAG TPA: OmpA family protein [Ferruginibacter sp.]|nr:OmpA family protein [Ferruginibacter sp.]